MPKCDEVAPVAVKILCAHVSDPLLPLCDRQFSQRWRCGGSMRRWCALCCIGLLPGFVLAGDIDDEALQPLWCGKTAELVTSLKQQSYVSRRRAESGGEKHEWFVGPREVIVLQHNADGTSCIAAEGEWPPPTIQARP